MERYFVEALLPEKFMDQKMLWNSNFVERDFVETVLPDNVYESENVIKFQFCGKRLCENTNTQ